MRTCPSCEGKRGHYSYGRRVSKYIKCPTCGGTGEVSEDKHAQVLKTRQFLDLQRTGAWPSNTCEACKRVGGCCQHHHHHIGDCCLHCGNDERYR
jgi:hypothetical protein